MITKEFLHPVIVGKQKSVLMLKNRTIILIKYPQTFFTGVDIINTVIFIVSYRGYKNTSLPLRFNIKKDVFELHKIRLVIK